MARHKREVKPAPPEPIIINVPTPFEGAIETLPTTAERVKATLERRHG